MTNPDPEQYDRLFPVVRAALMTDIGYSIRLAEAARRAMNFRATRDANRAARDAERVKSGEDASLT